MTLRDVEKVKAAIAKTNGGSANSLLDLEDSLSTLEQYECWEPYFRLLQQQIENPNTRQSQHFIRLARVQNLYLDDTFAAAETCADLVKRQLIDYREFTESVFPQILEFEDWTSEAAILSTVEDHFRRREDKIACLERLCIIYEKKIHNDAQLTKTYERLLTVDSKNIKALRYFKLVYTQSNEWEEVVGILKTLLTISSRPQEIFRYAQELAAIFLYQLDMADEAVATIENNCLESPLDTSTILYDAYHRLSNWSGCLRVLRESLLNVESDRIRAIVHIKIAAIHEHLNQPESAAENFAKSLKLAPDLLDALEGSIGIAVMRKDWHETIRLMNLLADEVRDERQITQLRQAIRRLQDGINNAEQH